MDLPTLTSILPWFLCAVAVIIGLYSYLTRNYGFWESKGIPTVKTKFPLENLWKGYKMPLHILEQDNYVKYGRLYGFYDGTQPVLSLAEPYLLKTMLVKDFHIFVDRRDFHFGHSIADNMLFVLEGDSWKRVRTIVTPAFTSGKMRKMQSLVLECADTLTENFLKAAEDGKYIDCKVYFGAFTMDVIASCAFGTKTNALRNPDSAFTQFAKEAFSSPNRWRLLFAFAFPGIMKLFKIPAIDPSGMEFFKELTLKIIDQRKHSPETKRIDFLQLLLETMDNKLQNSKEDIKNVNNYGYEEENFKFFNNKLQNKYLTQDELVAQCVIFFLAGYETTASALSYIVYLLALNQDCQNKLYQEIDETLHSQEHEIYEAVSSMKYLDAVVCESIRIYPPAAFGKRCALEDYTFDDIGLTIPKDTPVRFPIYAMHHDPKNFPDPEKFDPDRFLPENKSNIIPYTYMPFGAGPRNCIGMRFALMEIKLCLVHILRHLRFLPCSETKVPLKFLPSVLIIQISDVTLKVESRNGHSH
ncbi:cytochrome P450 3A8-like isoform X2 [Tachypleus tridentatus]|uniref:cytochrome P450 3A8-like isoform X2 n=1 Tax=Tachypleus tridentatus TaxID=6853 RepID=UPI003FCFFCB4